MQSDETFMASNVADSSSIKFVGKWRNNLRKCAWLVRVDGFDSKAKLFEQFSSGICIGSEGFVLSSKKSLESYIEGGELNFKSVYGRTHDGDFKYLHVLWSDSLSDLVIFAVDDTDMKYHYTGISSDLPVRGSQLLAIGNDNDQPFSVQDCYSTAPAEKMYKLAEDTTIHSCVDYPSRMYLPIYGLGQHASIYTFGDTRALTCHFGNGVFDKSGLVGVVAAWLQLPPFCFATPLIGQVIERFEKSDELKEYRSKMSWTGDTDELKE